MASSATRTKRTLNPRIEPATWIQHEAYIREHHSKMDLEELLKKLQHRGLPISKHQLTLQLSKWGLKKYKDRITGEIELQIRRTSSNLWSQTIADIGQDRGLTAMNDQLSPEALLSIFLGDTGILHERTVVPFEYGANKLLPPIDRSQLGEAETVIFGIPNQDAWTQLTEVGLNTAAVICACDWWWSRQWLGEEVEGSAADATIWSWSFLSMLGYIRRNWSLYKLKFDPNIMDRSVANCPLRFSCAERIGYVHSPEDLITAIAIENCLKAYKNSDPEKWKVLGSSHPHPDLDAYICVYYEMKQSLMIRVHIFVGGSSRVAARRMIPASRPGLRAVRDEELELNLRQLLSRMIHVSEHPTGVEFNLNGCWIMATSFQVLSVAISVYYLRRYTVQACYGIWPEGREQMLKQFQGNVSWNLQLIQDVPLCKEKLDDIDFGRFILNLAVIGNKDSPSDITLNEQIAHYPVSLKDYRSGSERLLVPQSHLQELGIVEEVQELNRPESSPPASTSSTDLTSTSTMGTHESSALGLRVSTTEFAISRLPLDARLTRPLKGPRYPSLHLPLEETERSNDTVPRYSWQYPGPSKVIESRHHISLEQIASTAEVTGSVEIRPHSPVSTSSKSEELLPKEEEVQEIVDLTLASGRVIVQHREARQVTEQEFDFYSVPPLAISLSSMQMSDASSLRRLRKLHEKQTFKLDSLLSLPSTRSSNLPTFSSLYPISISEVSSSHGRRRKKIKKSKEPLDYERSSNPISRVLLKFS